MADVARPATDVARAVADVARAVADVARAVGVGFQRPIGTVSQSSPGMFFYRVVPVPPSRFRPYQVTGEQVHCDHCCCSD